MENFAAPARPIVAAHDRGRRRRAGRARSRSRARRARTAMSRRSRRSRTGCRCPASTSPTRSRRCRPGRADCAIIPIENSLHGRVADIHFLLPESGLVITGEHFLPIRHALMGVGAARRRARGDEPSAGARPMPPLAEARTASRRSPIPTPRARRRWSPSCGDPAVAALAPPARGGDLRARRCSTSDMADAEHNITRFVTLARGGTRPVGRRAVHDDPDLRGEEHPRRAVQGDGRLRDQRRQHDQAGKLPARRQLRGDRILRRYRRAARATRRSTARSTNCGFHSKWVRLLGTYPQARARG